MNPSIWQSADKVWLDFQLATLSSQPNSPYGLLQDHLMVTGGGKILQIVPSTNDLRNDIHQTFSGEIVVGEGRLLTPGFIDCHTHLVFGGNRVSEWERRLLGESYQSIAASGGGILSTVAATRTSTEEELFESALERLKVLTGEGITTVEIKSGYGLDLDTERKMLRVARRLREAIPIDIEITFLGAHALPPEYAQRPDPYIDLVCQQMIPAVAEECSAVDVFCEKIAFDVNQSRRVLQSGLDHGLKIKIHAEQLSHLGGSVMAAELGALSVDHIEYLTEDDCRTIAELGKNAPLASAAARSTVATLLPGAFYFLRETQRPPVKALIENGIPIAVATDFNPGSSPLLSIRTAGNMACQFFGLTVEQVLRGVTLHAAQALGLDSLMGTLEIGKQADFAIWDVSSPAEIFYTLGGNPCHSVYKRGERI